MLYGIFPNGHDANDDAKSGRSSRNAGKIVIDDAYQSLAAPALPRPRDLDSHGLGEGGQAVRLLDLSADDQRKQEDSIQTFAVNQFISEKISLHRRLRDPRHEMWVLAVDELAKDFAYDVVFHLLSN